MGGDGEVFSDDQLVDGMSLSLRLRRDFSVTDAGQLLAAARRLYTDLNPGASAEDADSRLEGYARDGLKVGGWRAQVVPNEPWPLSPRPRQDCLRGDVFALPPDQDKAES